MPFKTLQIETFGCYALPSCAVRIKRQSDLTFYDTADSTFKFEANCQDPWLNLGQSQSPNAVYNAEVYVAIDPKQWTDGDYTIYWHDISDLSNKMVVQITEVTVFDGDPTTRKCPSTTDIAGRVLDATVTSHTMPGSLGATLTQILNTIKAIQTKVGA